MRIDIEPVTAQQGGHVALPNDHAYRYVRAIIEKRDGKAMIVGFWLYNEGDPDLPPKKPEGP